MRQPYFSIVIPTYQRGHLIQKTVHSVLSQSFEDFEVHVIDDGSTDNTREIVLSINDERLHYHFKENEERGAARNFGTQKSKGEYITFLDSDDLFYRDHLGVAHNFLTNQKKPPWYHQAYEIRNTKGILKYRYPKLNPPFEDSLIRGNSLSCMGVFLRQDVAFENPFVEHPTLAGSEDWELWLRIGCKYSLQYNPQITSCLVAHEGRSVINSSSNKLIKRLLRVKSQITGNPSIQNRWGNRMNTFLANLYGYLSLHLLLKGDEKRGTYYFIKAVRKDLGFIFTKKAAVLIKLRLLGR